jgi:hypothetical protein
VGIVKRIRRGRARRSPQWRTGRRDRRAVAPTLAAALVLGACGGAGAGAQAGLLDRPAVVSWTAAQARWGVERLEVAADGRAVYEFRPAGGRGVPLRIAGLLGPGDVDYAQRTFRESNLCGIRSQRQTGAADEAQPTLRVRFPDLGCEVTLWEGEWDGLPRARACKQVILFLVERLREPIVE